MGGLFIDDDVERHQVLQAVRRPIDGPYVEAERAKRRLLLERKDPADLRAHPFPTDLL
jgi:hypothetical protein